MNQGSINEDVNRTKALKIEYLPSLTTKNNNNIYSLYFDIINLTQSKIWFPVDMNVNIEAWNTITSQWVKMTNNVSYIPINDSFVLNTSQDTLERETVFVIAPEIPSELKDQSQIRMRITIKGLILKNDQVTDQEILSEYIFNLKNE
jgi:hypothetical protein